MRGNHPRHLRRAGLGCMAVLSAMALEDLNNLALAATPAISLPIPIPPEIPITPVQTVAAGILNNAFSSTSIPSDLVTVHDTLTGLTAPQQQSALTEISGVSYTGLPSLAVGLTHSANDAVLGHILSLLDLGDFGVSGQTALPIRLASAGSPDELKYLIAQAGEAQPNAAQPASQAPTSGLWFQGIGNWNRVTGNANVPGISSSGGGVIAGYDAAVGNGYRAGASFGYAHTDGEQTGGLASTALNTYRLVGYGTYESGPLVAALAVDLALERFRTSRVIDLGGTSRVATSSHNGVEESFSVQAGYRLSTGEVNFTPFISADYVHLDQDGFTESGASSLNLKVAANHFNSLQPEMGMRVGRVFMLDRGAVFAPDVVAGFRYELLDATTSGSALLAQNASAGSLDILGVSVDRAVAHLGTKLAYRTPSALILYASYDAQLSGNQTVQSIGAGLRFEF